MFKLPVFNNHFSSKFGFTMIELMITVTIMMLMLGGGIAAYIRFNDRQTLQGASKQLETQMRSAQKKARVGDIPDGCDRLVDYRVSMTTGSSDINIDANCTNQLIRVSTTTLNSNISVNADFVVAFKVLHGGTEFVTGNSNIFLTSDTYQYQFQVTPGGSIEGGTIENIASPIPTPSASPSAVPSPSPSPTLQIILNQTTNLSCTTMCSQLSKTCIRVGTDANGTDSSFIGMTNGVCTRKPATCDTIMNNYGNPCFGYKVRTTNCVCQ